MSEKKFFNNVTWLVISRNDESCEKRIVKLFWECLLTSFIVEVEVDLSLEV